MNGLISITRSKLLLGEGKEELRLFQAKIKHLGLDQEIQVLEYGGLAKLGPFLKTLRATHGFAQVQALGVTRDADANAQDAEQSVAALIANAGFPATLTTRIFVLPGAGRNGALEDLCLEAICTHPVWPCVDELIACRSRTLGPWPDSAALAKAKIQAWLSTQSKPSLRLGEAAENGLLPFDAAAFAPFAAFIRSL